MNHVGHNYFDVMGIPIVKGRAFVEDDEREHSRTRKVAIINESMAAKYWPGQDPIGKRFRAFNLTEPLLEIVGVARDSKTVLVFESPRPYIYLPLVRDMSLRTLHVRAVGQAAALAPRLEREIKDLAPDLPIADLRTMTQSLSGIFGYLIFRVGAIQAAAWARWADARAHRRLRRRVVWREPADPRDRHSGRAGRPAARCSQADSRPGTAAHLGRHSRWPGASVAMGRVLSRFLPLVDAADWGTFGAWRRTRALGALGVLRAGASCHPVPVMRALRHE